MDKKIFQFHHLMMITTVTLVFISSFINIVSAFALLLFGILIMIYDIADTLRNEKKIEVTVEVSRDGAKDVNVS